MFMVWAVYAFLSATFCCPCHLLQRMHDFSVTVLPNHISIHDLLSDYSYVVSDIENHVVNNCTCIKLDITVMFKCSIYY
jgi:hypothetical protein